MQKKRGRKSAASLEIAGATTLELVERPACPHDLSDEEAEVWFGIVNRLPADWFPTETHPLLIQYCRHSIQARRVDELLEKATADPELSIGAYDKILHMQDRESRALATLATKLRISQQATTNHRGNKKQVAPRKPWE